MALVHSLWTQPMISRERGVSLKKQLETMLWCYASSVAFAHRYNVPIVLYTDKMGRQLLSHLPYTQVYDLDIPEDTPTELWAAGKFYALKKMQLGDIHIDGDVFLKTSEVHKLVHDGMQNNDLIVQSTEDSWEVLSEWYKDSRDVVNQCDIRLLYECTANYSHAWNCGVVGINNQRLKDMYLESYFCSLKQVKERPEVLKAIHSKTHCIMDLLFEQQHLYELSKEYKVYNLLGSGKEAYSRSAEIGYQHILGSSKWECLRSIRKQLKRVDPELYEMTKVKIKYVIH